MNTLMDCVAHGTSHEDFLATFDGDVNKALAHLEKFYRDQMAEYGEDVDEDEIEEMRDNARRTMRNLSISNAAAALGSIKSERKAKSSAANGKLGGRPRNNKKQ